MRRCEANEDGTDRSMDAGRRPSGRGITRDHLKIGGSDRSLRAARLREPWS